MILKIKVQFTKTLVESKKILKKIEKQIPNSAVLITNLYNQLLELYCSNPFLFNEILFQQS